MKVSLITTVKNEAQHADSLIRAILQQTRQPDEWIVVDGGSVDDTAVKFRAIPLCTVLEHSCNRARGRNLAIILEVAALNHRLREFGVHPAEQLNRRVMEAIQENAQS